LGNFDICRPIHKIRPTFSRTVFNNIIEEIGIDSKITKLEK